MPELVINDFAAGIRDEVVDGPINSAQVFDNFLISRNKKAYSRPGSRIYDASNPKISTNGRVTNLQFLGASLIAQSANRLFKDGTILTGPTGNDVFGTVGDTTSRTAADKWKDHLYWTTNGGYSQPRKIYDSSGIKVRNAGLRAILNDPVVTPSAGAAKNYIYFFHHQYEYSIGDVVFVDRGPVRIVSQTGGPDFSGSSNAITRISSLANGTENNWDTSVVTVEIYRTEHNGTIGRFVGRVTNGTTTFTDTVADADLGEDIYIASGEQDDDEPPEAKYLTVADNAAWYANVREKQLVISHFVAVANTANVLNSKYFLLNSAENAVNFYVWYNGGGGVDPLIAGRTGHMVTIASGDSAATVANNTRSSMTSGTISSYFDVAAGTPPGATLRIITKAIGPTDAITDGNTGFTFSTLQTGYQTSPSRVRQSKQNNLGGAPASNFTDVDGAITGISSIGSIPMVFTLDKTTRLEGVVDELGEGFTRARTISETVGCINHNSIVRTIDGLYFASLDGYYFTDGFKVIKLSDHLDKTYRHLSETAGQKANIFGSLDDISGRVYWSVQKVSTDTEVQNLLVLDPYFGLRSESTFTTWSGGADFPENFRPTALCFDNGDLIRGDSRGYMFRHGVDDKDDPLIETLLPVASWHNIAVQYDWISAATSFGTERLRKWVTRLLAVLNVNSQVSVLPQSINDLHGAKADLKIIRDRSVLTWGDETLIWSDPDLIWNFLGVVIRYRRFPKGTLRCTYKQLRLTNAVTVIARSDDLGPATINTTLKTVTLDTVGRKWPVNIIGHTFTPTSSADDYEILIRNSDTVITVSDPGNSLVAGSAAWEMTGINRGEKIQIESLTILYEVFGPSHKTYKVAEAGENA